MKNEEIASPVYPERIEEVDKLKVEKLNLQLQNVQLQLQIMQADLQRATARRTELLGEVGVLRSLFRSKYNADLDRLRINDDGTFTEASAESR